MQNRISLFIISIAIASLLPGAVADTLGETRAGISSSSSNSLSAGIESLWNMFILVPIRLIIAASAMVLAVTTPLNICDYFIDCFNILLTLIRFTYSIFKPLCNEFFSFCTGKGTLFNLAMNLAWCRIFISCTQGFFIWFESFLVTLCLIPCLWPCACLSIFSICGGFSITNIPMQWNNLCEFCRFFWVGEPTDFLPALSYCSIAYWIDSC